MSYTTVDRRYEILLITALISSLHTSVDTDIFRPEVSTLTLEPGITSEFVFVGIRNDDIYEADESFSVRIVSISRGTVDPDEEEVTVTILDDDSQLNIALIYNNIYLQINYVVKHSCI